MSGHNLILIMHNLLHLILGQVLQQNQPWLVEVDGALLIINKKLQLKILLITSGTLCLPRPNLPQEGPGVVMTRHKNLSLRQIHGHALNLKLQPRTEAGEEIHHSRKLKHPKQHQIHGLILQSQQYSQQMSGELKNLQKLQVAGVGEANLSLRPNLNLKLPLIHGQILKNQNQLQEDGTVVQMM